MGRIFFRTVWDEMQHPRVPKGLPGAGQFAPRGAIPSGVGKEKPYFWDEAEELLSNARMLRLPPGDKAEEVLSRGFYRTKDMVLLEGNGRGVVKWADWVHFHPDEVRKEAAVYLVSKGLGFDVVPPTVMRTLPERPSHSEEVARGDFEFSPREVSVQLYIEGAQTGVRLIPTARVAMRAPSSDPESERKLRRYFCQRLRGYKEMLFLDLLTANFDRHGENWLVKGDRVYAIDNSLSFPATLTGWAYFDAEVREYWRRRGATLWELEAAGGLIEQRNILSRKLSRLLGDDANDNFWSNLTSWLEESGHRVINEDDPLFLSYTDTDNW